jgi:predicted RNA-binding Zn ribbon-like protein
MPITCQMYLRRLWFNAEEVVPVPQKSPAIFITDSVALNFLNSVATPADTTVDWISDGDGLLAWFEQAQLAPVEALDLIRKRAEPEELDRVAAQARNLREWFRTFVRNSGKPPKAAALADVEPLNRILATDEGFEQLVAHKRGKTTALRLQRARRWRSPESILLPIGEAMAKLLAEENLSDVKTCEGATCTLMFVDRTRARSRRWCSMGICGNRAKQIAHRHRLKDLR